MGEHLRGLLSAVFCVVLAISGLAVAQAPQPTACPVPSQAAIAQWERGLDISLAQVMPEVNDEPQGEQTPFATSEPPSDWILASDASEGEPSEPRESDSNIGDIIWLPQAFGIATWPLRAAQSVGLYAGCEFVWINPQFARSEAFDLSDELYWQPGIESETKFESTWSFSPRCHLGWKGDSGYGVRATFWHYDHCVDSQYKELLAYEYGSSYYGITTTGDLYSAFGMPMYLTATGDWARASVFLEMQTLDLEVTGQPRAGWWGFQVTDTFGVRYARHDQDYKLVRHVDGSDDFLRLRHGFEGWGLTASRDLRHILFRRQDLVFLGRLRASFLWSNDCLSLEERGFLFLGGSSPDAIKSRETHAIGELLLGIEHRHDLGAIGVLTLRGSLEAQLWGDAGSPLYEGGSLSLFGLGLAAELSR